VSEKIEQAGRYRNLAREARDIAVSTRSPKDRGSLLNLANEYERMARELEDEEAAEKILRQIGQDRA
jgi:hypothetical protein